MVDFEHGERAVTHYRVLERKQPAPCFSGEDIPDGGLSLLSLHLDTGRTHQIRVHMSYTGHPLIGDFLYNPKSRLMGRQALHAWRLDFTHPVTGEPLTFSAPVPRDMQRFFEVRPLAPRSGFC